jgi:hypothetical protein
MQSNSTLLHASYAFNTYFQKHQQGDGTCYFDGVATITQRDPSVGTCIFPIGLDSSAIASDASGNTGKAPPRGILGESESRNE